jgi:hypothetical protein
MRPPSDLPFEEQPRWVLVYRFKPAPAPVSGSGAGQRAVPLFVVEVYIDFDMLLIDCFLGYCSKNSAIRQIVSILSDPWKKRLCH